MESSGRSLWVSRDRRRNIKEENSIFSKLSNNDKKQLFDLADIVAEIESIMRYPSYVTVFAYYNSSSGANPLVAKLPTNLQERWTTGATKYKSANNVPYPPFSVFFSSIYTIQPKSEMTLASSTRKSMSQNQLIIETDQQQDHCKFQPGKPRWRLTHHTTVLPGCLTLAQSMVLITL